VKHIILYGHLAKKFGRHHHMDVRTPSEALRALSANHSEFRQHVLQHNEPGYYVRVGKEYRNVEGLVYPADDVIKIIPAVGGRGKVGALILGAALIVFAPYAAGWLLANTSMVGLATAVATMAPQIGMSLILGGISQLLFAPPKSQSVESPDNKPSYAFDGPVNTMTQGNPVPVCYGRMIVGSQVISASMEAGDIAI
jgi:predicted phage tail protein